MKKLYTQNQVDNLLQMQRIACAEAVRKPYVKTGMTNLAARAFNACVNAIIDNSNES